VLTTSSRLTPVPGRSRSRSISSSSGPSNGDQPSPNSTSISAASQSSQPPRPAAVFNTLPVPPAELGLGTLQGEEQLKSALQSKDRLFLIMVSREIESFVRQVAAGQAPSAAAAIAVGTASTSLLAGHSSRGCSCTRRQSGTDSRRSRGLMRQYSLECWDRSVIKGKNRAWGAWADPQRRITARRTRPATCRCPADIPHHAESSAVVECDAHRWLVLSRGVCDG
jgi:hypothetical protein